MSYNCESCEAVIPTETSQGTTTTFNKNRRFRALFSYWILGLCNNYGYVVMLTATNEILKKETGGDTTPKEETTARDCTYLSTGAILLADILPGLIIKVIAPFLPFFVHLRVAICVVLAASGFLCVAYSETLVIALLGVVMTSLASGLGEVTYMQYSSFYDKNVISTWSSGTGGAGVIGAATYAILAQVHLEMRTILQILLVVPVAMGLAFWLLLPRPSQEDIAHALEIQNLVNSDELKNPKQAFIKKLKLIPGLLKYIIPFSLVYVFEYFINQGTFELIRIKNSSISNDDQYRWFQVTYQIGVFFSRSSVNLFHIKQTWWMTLFQGINVVIFTTEAVFYYIPNFYIVVVLVLWEGLLGGSSYVNTFYRISTEVAEENKQFSMAITTFGDSIGITLAGFLAIFAHNKICALPLPN
ncbi:battenin isoform X1 [Diabrotica virgifera virgifera]|uniref:Battenin n=1 Tax=Diabrotica virgifera virgifera TaxID=50390 RepID=A0ABM5JH74_DIAVI|nr:battenin isoform X1 [Diabrotica virgifera virgifera]